MKGKLITKKGEPKRAMITFDCTPELYSQIYELAKKEERSVSAMVRIAIKDYINKTGIQLKVFS